MLVLEILLVLWTIVRVLQNCRYRVMRCPLSGELRLYLIFLNEVVQVVCDSLADLNLVLQLSLIAIILEN